MAENSKIVKCPVCKCEIWSHALKIHITNSGKAELYKAAHLIMEKTKNDTFVFSRVATLRVCPHYAFRKRNIINKKVFELQNGTKIQGRRQGK